MSGSPSTASASKPAGKGTMAAFLKPKSTPDAVRPAATLNAKAPASAPKAKPAKPAPPKQLGAKPPPSHEARFLSSEMIVVPSLSTSETSDDLIARVLDKLYVKEQHTARPLTQDARDATLKLLPVVLYESVRKRWIALVTHTSESSPFGGGTIYLASAHGVGTPGLHKPLKKDEAGFIFNGLTAWSPGHVGAASPQIASLLWRLKATFKNLEWETVNVQDVKATLDAAKQHVDVVPLSVPPAPQHVLKDYETLPINDTEDKDAMKKALSVWQDKGQHWTPPPGKWPCFPIAQHDPRASKLGSRTDLAAAVSVLVRTASMPSIKQALPGDALGKGLHTLIGVEASAPAPALAKPSLAAIDDAEEAATASLLAPPKPKEKPPPKKKPPSKKDMQLSGASFVRGARGIENSDDDSMSEGDPGENEGEESEDGFIASEDDVDEAGSTTSARKKRSAKSSKKRKERFEKNVNSGDDDDDSDGDCSQDEESSDEEEMSDGGSDDGEEEGDDDDDDDELVDARKNASDVDDVMASDDDDEAQRSAAAPKSRLVKASERNKGKQPRKKKTKVVPDEDAEDDGAGALPPSALLAQQRLSGERSAGDVPPPKMGASLDRGIKARHAASMVAVAPVPKDSAAIAEPASLFTPTKAADKGTHKAPGAPGPSARPPRDNARQARFDRADAYKSIDGRIRQLAAKPGSIVGLPERGAFLLTERASAGALAFEQLREDRSIEHYNEVIKHLLGVTSHLVTIVEAADSDDKTRKKHDNANAELGTVAAQSLLQVVPQIEALQRAVANVNSMANTLVGTSAGMATRIAHAAAKKSATEGK